MSKLQRYRWEDTLIAASAAEVITSGVLLTALRLASNINWQRKQPGLYWANEDAAYDCGVGRSAFYAHRKALLLTGFVASVNGNLVPTLPQADVMRVIEDDQAKRSAELATRLAKRRASRWDSQPMPIEGSSEPGAPASADKNSESTSGTEESLGHQTLSEDSLSESELSEDSLTELNTSKSSVESASPPPRFDTHRGKEGTDSQTSPLPPTSAGTASPSDDSHLTHKTCPLNGNQPVPGGYTQKDEVRKWTSEEVEELIAGWTESQVAQEHMLAIWQDLFENKEFDAAGLRSAVYNEWLMSR